MVGAIAGLLVSAVGVVIRGRWTPDEPPGPAQLPPLWGPMARSVRTVDEHARDGLRRALPLGFGIYLVESQATRDAVWILVAAFVVLLPTGKPPVPVMVLRVGTTLVGVVVLGLLALVVPHEVLFGAAIVLVLAGTAYGNRFPLPAGAATTMGAILFAGAPGDAIGTWASHRLLDTIIGSTLALAATYLLWPRDPADARADASV
ncbi:MAG: FUSC family protein [Acidimicrobiales bacterium]